MKSVTFACLASIAVVTVASLVGCGGADPTESTGDQSASAINGSSVPSAGDDVPDPSTGETPDPSTGEKPSSSTGEKPSSSTGGKPSSSTGEKPSSSTGEKPSSSTGKKLPSTTGFIPHKDPAPTKCGTAFCGAGEKCCASDASAGSVVRGFCVPLYAMCIAP